MKPHRAGLLLASGSALALLLAACGGSPARRLRSRPPARCSPTTRTATVMDDGWDPATEYSNDIIAMSNMYETLTRYDSTTHKVEPLLATSWSHVGRRPDLDVPPAPRGALPHRPADDRRRRRRPRILRTIKLGGGAAVRLGRGEDRSTPPTSTRWSST